MHRMLLVLLVGGFWLAACNNSSEKSSQSEPVLKADTAIQPEHPVLQEGSSDTTSPVKEVDTAKPVSAQTTNAMRLGYINSVEILDKMPDVKQADQRVQQFAQQLDQEIKRKSNELQQTYQAYSQDTSVSEALLKTRMLELQQMQQNLSDLQYNSQQELAQRKTKEYQPILKKIDDAIGKVAKREGYTHVLDASAGSLVYGDDQYDITPLVLKELGL